MKKIVLIAIAMFTLNVMAQEREIKTTSGEKITETKQEKSAETIASAETKKMTVQLELTTEQQTKVYDVLLDKAETNLEYRAKRIEMKKSKEKMSKEDYKKIRMEIIEKKAETDEKMKEILTAKQYQGYQEIYGKKPKVKVKSN